MSVDLNTDIKALKENIFKYLLAKKHILNSPRPKIEKNRFELTIKPWCLLDHFLELDTTLENLLKGHISKTKREIELENSFISKRKLMAS